MAPRYATSLRYHLPVLAFLLQTTFIVIFSLYVEIKHDMLLDGDVLNTSYAVFQDVHVMVFLGFGFLATFLVRYAFSAVGVNVLVAAMAVQWAALMNGFLLSPWHRGKMMLSLRSLVDAELCAASSLVAMGAVLGKVNPVQLLVMVLLEVTGFVVNRWLLQILLKNNPLNSLMFLHIFGAFFGMMTSWALYRKALEPPHEKEKFDRKTGLFSFMGTIFLWLFWPSFNSVLVDDTLPWMQFRAICSSYLSLATSAVTAISISVLTSPRGKINLVNVQSSTLAGGVAIGVALSVVHLPWIAMTIGLFAALLSTVGFRYIKSNMDLVFESHDTCGVVYAHGIPGLLGWLAHLVLKLPSSDTHTTAVRFAVYHISILLITVSTSLTMGLVTGLLLKGKIWRPQTDRKCFDDQAFWQFPHLAVK